MKAEQGINKRNIVESYCKCSFRMIDEADLLFIVYGESYPLRYRYNTYKVCLLSRVRVWSVEYRVWIVDCGLWIPSNPVFTYHF